MQFSRTTLSLVTAAFITLSIATAQTPILYHVALENRAHHEAQITVTFSELPPTALELRMSRSSPGRYSLHEFARHVHNIVAVDGGGRPLTVERMNPHQWNVSGHSGTVKVTYTLFGDKADGTYTGIDATHAHLNMPATFLYANGQQEKPIRITFEQPDDEWKIVTQLVTTRWSDTFTAPNLQYFMDSPTEIGPGIMREWDSGEDDHGTFRLALHHDGTDAEADAYAEVAKAIVLEERAIMGEYPEFDHGTYTFIADYLPYVSGDGMEHRNSTILTSTGSLKTHLNGIMGTMAHEFFHVWNVERIRPRDLEPFDFSRTNAAAEMWFAEGFTSYYDDLVLKRAGIIHLDRLARGLTRTVNAVHNAPGRDFYGASGMSQRAPLFDRASFSGPSNYHNTFLNYYTYGAYLGLALDLTLRTKFTDLTLDNFMAEVWLAHGKTEAPYTNTNLQAILARVTGDDRFAEQFFSDHVLSGKLPEIEPLLTAAGMILRKQNPDDAWLGSLNVRPDDDGGLTLRSQTTIGSPLYNAGLERNDVIISINGAEVNDADALDELIAEQKPGATVELTYKGRSGEQTVNIKLIEDPRLEVVPAEHDSQEVTQEALTLRSKWLSQQSTSGPYGLERHCPTCKRSFPFANEYCHYDGEALVLALEDDEEE